jgi:hypothetical protein
LRSWSRALRVAALYDVHGNLPALQAVLEEVERENLFERMAHERGER